MLAFHLPGANGIQICHWDIGMRQMMEIPPRSEFRSQRALRQTTSRHALPEHRPPAFMGLDLGQEFRSPRVGHLGAFGVTNPGMQMDRVIGDQPQ